MTESFRIALAGNPNTGKSTLFNLLTGLKQHTGNWAGKTVNLKTGLFSFKNNKYEMIDLPGTYSLFSNSMDEKIARDYLVFEKPDVTLVILDATALERNMNLALQVMEITDRVIICINLIDEAEKLGIEINDKVLMKRLGVPVIKVSARNKSGISMLLDTIDRVVSGTILCTPYQVTYDDETEQKIKLLLPKVLEISGDKFPARWLSLRMLDGDRDLLQMIEMHISKMEV
ncbi:iron transporter FeoB [Halalkalibacterium halodurans]|uniref:FeoB small GTPase domain-containing protein n=1 Tax=Halalkalibacterium halodurans TaxID=86665 RepID=UPI001068505F|nr:FeoB small GTPase domain-containing protein [Halalkalibacterium halodurans]TES57695.1 iron transporter FeoB [Halalkalibacterium halodurans]